MTGDRHDAVADLNRLMAEEAEAFLRYFQIRFRLRGRDRRTAEKFFEEAMKETLEHADAIARQIRALGHIPTLRINLSLGGGPVRSEEALAEALDVEQQALDAYKDFLPRIADDPVLEAFVQKQIDVETGHVQQLREVVGSAATLTLVVKNKPTGN